MNISNEDRACLWLAEANISTNVFEQLLHIYSSAYEILLNYKNDKVKIFSKEQIIALDTSLNMLDSNIDTMYKDNIHVLCYNSKSYPNGLNCIKDKPYALFYKGNLDVLNKPSFAIVGTRHPSFYGQKIAALLSKELSKAGACIVSGMALGIDTYAHKSAIIENHANTCAVCGCGLNVNYPVQNKELKESILQMGGLILSEYTANTSPRSYFFPYRNRIISGLSRAIIFVEGDIRSGGMLTVDRAIEQNKQVYAVPGNIDARFSKGPNYLISSGIANAISDVEDFVQSLNISENSSFLYTTDNIKNELDDIQLKIYNLLEIESASFDEIVYKLNINPNELQSAVGYMELLGYIRRVGGGIYSI